jgi:hypothetical protein
VISLAKAAPLAASKKEQKEKKGKANNKMKGSRAVRLRLVAGAGGGAGRCSPSAAALLSTVRRSLSSGAQWDGQDRTSSRSDASDVAIRMKSYEQEYSLILDSLRYGHSFYLLFVLI